jgi:hypothetical protein
MPRVNMSVKEFAVMKRRLALFGTILTIVNGSFSIAGHAQAAIKVLHQEKINNVYKMY